ncbi:MAG: metallophosphoesterase [Vicinamibacterales bacterium]
MRVAIVSDTHFGDDLCTLVTEPVDGGPARLGPGYPAFRRAVGRVDYLILLGDVLDFSVAYYEKAYRHAKVFFTALQQDQVAGQLIYIPGNHDFDIWHIVEHQVNVINQLKQGELPRAFKRSVPGVLDDRRTDPAEKFRLPDVTPKPEWHDNRAKYGNLFLDNITRRPGASRGVRAEGRKLTFNFAYPNLYLVGDDGESVLVTHGHYFEAYWAMASDWLMHFAADHVPLETPGEPNLQELVGMNLPLNQLACTGIGQAQPLTWLIRAVQREVDAGRVGVLAGCLDRLEARILDERRHLSRVRRAAERYVLGWLKRWVLTTIATAEGARYSRQFLQRQQVRERFRRYFRYSLNEIRQLSREHGIDVPTPSHVVFGHTHQPIAWGADELVDTIDGREVRFCNTGGWLLREEADGRTAFVGAEVVLYESGRGFSSVTVGGEDLSAEFSEPREQLSLAL